MKKYLFTAALLCSFCLSAFCQYTEEHRIDSLKIDSMRRIVPFLKDSAKVDCLNSLSEKWPSFHTGYNSEGFKIRGDSMYKYAMMANIEATRISYKYGLATSLLNLALSYQIRGPKDFINIKAQKDSVLSKYRRQALQLAEELQNDELLGRVYYERSEGDNVDNYKQSIYHYQKAGNIKMELEVTTFFVWDLMGNENYDAIEYAERCIQLSKKITPLTSWEHELVEDALVNMGDLYVEGGDYETALDYFHQADKYIKTYSGWKIDIKFSELYYRMGQYDSALYYWQNWKKDYSSYIYNFQAWGNTILGKIYVKTGQFDKSIQILNQSLSAFKKGEKYDSVFSYALANPLIFIGAAYAGKDNYKTALFYAKLGLGFATKSNHKLAKIDGYKLASEIYHHLQNNDSAYYYLLKYISLKDSVQSKQFLWRLNNYKREAEDERKEAKLLLLNKDSQIKDQQLKQESVIRNFLIGGLLVLLIAGVFIYRTITLKRKTEKLQREQLESKLKVQQLENEKKQAELQQQATELEMQALRAQMNPHFIFNCLSSVNRFILKNESKIASGYLTRFSRLIRMALVNSQKPLITIEEELQMLRLYLDMERLRFKDSFDYSITFLNAIESDNIFIPPLLLQPFCENAIWHGLMQKEDQGRLDIELSMQNNILNCAITDNGIGREKAGEMKSKSAEKEKSMGLKITTERLALFNREKGVNTFYEIEDLLDENGNAAGTKVNLRISYKEAVKEPV